jgi:predicted nucleic acid-binding Zn ribbon protein
MENKRFCIECNKEEIIGRIDKKFCSDGCRNNYHNREKRAFRYIASDIDKILRKNRMILAELNPKKNTVASKEKLSARKFDFNFFTNIYRTKKGNTYFFCYDYGYTFLANEKVMIVTKSDYV